MSSYLPIALTGFNHDVIVSNTSQTPSSQVTSPVDNGNALCSYSYAISIGYSSGIPDNGTLIKNNYTYQLQPYTTNNSLRLPASQIGILTLVTPAKYSGLSILGLSTNGQSTITITVNYQDTTTETFNISIPDWFTSSSSNLVLGSLTRINTSTLSKGQTPPNAGLLNFDITPNFNKNISSIQFVNGVTTIANIFAISGVSYNTPVVEGKYLDENVFLSWTRGSYNSFKIYKSTNNIIFTTIGTSASSKYVDLGVQQNTLYYKVYAISGSTEILIGDTIMIKPTLPRSSNCLVKFTGNDGNAGITIEDGESNRIRSSIIPTSQTMQFDKIISSAISTYTQTIKDGTTNLSLDMIISYILNSTQFYNAKIILNYLYNSYSKSIIKVARATITCNIINNQVNVLDKTVTNNFPFAFTILDPVITSDNKIKVTLNVTESKISANSLAINDEIKVICDVEVTKII